MISRKAFFPAHPSANSLTRNHFIIAYRLRRDSLLLRLFQNRVRKGMAGQLLQRSRRAQKLLPRRQSFLSIRRCRDHIRHDRLSLRYRPGFIQYDRINTMGDFQRFRRFDQNPLCRAAPRADHDRRRRRKPQRARARNDQHGNRDRQRRFKALSRRHPHRCRNDSDHDHHRNKHAADLIRQLCDRRL